MNEEKGWVGGYGQFLSETNDGGETWESLGIGSRMNRIFFVSENLAYACGLSVFKWGETPSNLESLPDYIESKRFDWKIYPNLGDGKFQVNLELMTPNHVDLDLYSLEGKLFKNIFNGKLMSGNYQFEQEDALPNGTYIIGLQLNDGLFSKKIIVK